MNLVRPLSTALLIVGVTAAAAIAAPRAFVVAEDVHTPNEVSFTSRAAIVKFTGRTSKVTGLSEVNLDNVAASKGSIKVDLASLDTGIGLRNEHLRGTLSTDKYPTADFVLGKLTVPGNKLKPNAETQGTATGKMTIHGVTRTVTAPVTLTFLPQQDAQYRPGDWVQLESQFKLKLSEYGVALPQGVLGVKVADEVAINVVTMAKAQ